MLLLGAPLSVSGVLHLVPKGLVGLVAFPTVATKLIVSFYYKLIFRFSHSPQSKASQNLVLCRYKEGGLGKNTKQVRM